MLNYSLHYWKPTHQLMEWNPKEEIKFNWKRERKNLEYKNTEEIAQKKREKKNNEKNN